MQFRESAPCSAPHARGADDGLLCHECGKRPLPPRTWGRPHGLVVAQIASPSTPTHVGPTTADTPSPGDARLYPHARGADSRDCSRYTASPPLPPRTWGRRRCHRAPTPPLPSTPTHVGPTVGCGSVRRSAVPLPPRTWGRRDGEAERPGRAASTPTHVGPTLLCGCRWCWRALYPHARGADGDGDSMTNSLVPLPPRTWGRPRRRAPHPGRPASTPTHVGPTCR